MVNECLLQTLQRGQPRQPQPWSPAASFPAARGAGTRMPQEIPTSLPTHLRGRATLGGTGQKLGYYLGKLCMESKFFHASHELKYFSIPHSCTTTTSGNAGRGGLKIFMNLSLNRYRKWKTKVMSVGGAVTNSGCCHSTVSSWSNDDDGDILWLTMWKMHLCSWSTELGARESSVLHRDPEMDWSHGFGLLN